MDIWIFFLKDKDNLLVFLENHFFCFSKIVFRLWFKKYSWSSRQETNLRKLEKTELNSPTFSDVNSSKLEKCLYIFTIVVLVRRKVICVAQRTWIDHVNAVIASESVHIICYFTTTWLLVVVNVRRMFFSFCLSFRLSYFVLVGVNECCFITCYISARTPTEKRLRHP